MKELALRAISREDLPKVLEIINAEGWNYTIVELERMLRLDPGGSFLAEMDGPVGVVTSVSYSRTGVIGHLVVSRHVRGRRIGRALMERVLEYLDSMGVESTLVFATEEGVPLYRKLGFRATRDVFCLNAHLPAQVPSVSTSHVRRYEDRDHEQVLTIDARLFGDDRTKLMNLLLSENLDQTYVIEAGGTISGYVMARGGPLGYDLGPWVCLTGDSKDAAALFTKAVSGLERGLLFLGAFTENLHAMDIVGRLEPFRSWPIKLMVRGAERYPGSIRETYGVVGFELG